MRFYKNNDYWDEHGEEISTGCRFHLGERPNRNAYDLDESDSERMQKIIARCQEIEREHKRLHEEWIHLEKEGREIFLPYECAHEERVAEEKKHQEEMEHKRRQQEKEANAAMRQAISDWQREHKQRFPGFGC